MKNSERYKPIKDLLENENVVLCYAIPDTYDTDTTFNENEINGEYFGPSSVNSKKNNKYSVGGYDPV